MRSVLVIGASGFIGGALARSLLAEGFAVRCLARDPAKYRALAELGCEVVPGDVADAAAVLRAAAGVEAAYVSIHTLSPQKAAGPGGRFMDAERRGVENVAAACRATGARRVVYVTSFGIAPDAPGEWLRERWLIEEALLHGDVDATIVRPGMVVGAGGQGFDTVVRAAKRRVAVTLGDGRTRMRSIAIGDLVYYLRGVIDEPRAARRRFDVGNDDVMSLSEDIDAVASLLGRRPPLNVRVPAALLRAGAPLIERVAKLPRDAVRGFVDGMEADAPGDPLPLREILPKPLMTFRQAATLALAS